MGYRLLKLNHLEKKALEEKTMQDVENLTKTFLCKRDLESKFEYKSSDKIMVQVEDQESGQEWYHGEFVRRIAGSPNQVKVLVTFANYSSDGLPRKPTVEERIVSIQEVRPAAEANVGAEVLCAGYAEELPGETGPQEICLFLFLKNLLVCVGVSNGCSSNCSCCGPASVAMAPKSVVRGLVALSAPELKERLRRLGHSTIGTKSELLERYIYVDEDAWEAADREILEAETVLPP